MVRLYLWMRAALERWLALQRALFEGLWLGLLGRGQLHALDAACYDAWQQFSDPAYNRGGLLAWEESAVTSRFGGCRRLLVAAAGGGREVLALERLGYEVEAFECHGALAAAANVLLAEEGCAARVRAAPRDGCPDFSARLDGAIIGWGAYTLIQGRQHRVAFLRQLRRRLAVGAPLLVSFFHRRGEERGDAWRTAIAGALRRLRRRPPPELGDALAPNFVHRFSRDEIAAELAEGGFEMAHHDTRDYGHAVALAMPGNVARL